MKCDFSGYATRNDLKCADGRIIRKDAFKDNDKKRVPLVWNHDHDDPLNILGHAILENREDGVYAYGYFNDSESGQAAKTLVEHGDITGLSIYANHLKQNGSDVLHGVIREVSLVLAGANPGAYIDSAFAHSDDGEEDGIGVFGFIGEESIELEHSDKEEEKTDEDGMEEDTSDSSDNKETIEHADNNQENSIENILERANAIIDSMTDEQKTVMYALIGAVADDENDDEEEDSNMKHNVFDNDEREGGVLSHADQEKIISDAKKAGSFRVAMDQYIEDNALQHADGDPADVSGFTSYPSGDTPAGVDVLFPEYHDVRPGAPELVTNDNGWVDAILRKVHKSPFSRIRTSQVDLRTVQNYAKGYEKGTKKALAGNYSVSRRTTDPQTVYIKSALNRDDIIDITDFDYVAYQYKIDRMMLEELLATAMLMGDGIADPDADGKIDPAHIRPVWGDDDLFTIYKDMTPFMSDINGDFSGNFGDNYKYAEGAIAALLDAKIDFRGTGSQDMFCTQEFFNKMLLAKDLNGRRIYQTARELASALGVANIYPVSKMANKTRIKGTGQDAKTMQFDALIINWADYHVGSTKGGQITHFTQFDIDFNQEKSLIETRLSGANTRIYSAIVLEEVVSNP